MVCCWNQRALFLRKLAGEKIERHSLFLWFVEHKSAQTESRERTTTSLWCGQRKALLKDKPERAKIAGVALSSHPPQISVIRIHQR
jgi:hypothetical protein